MSEDKTDINAEKRATATDRKETRAKDKAAKQKETETSRGATKEFSYFISANPEEVAFDIRLAGQRFKGTWDDDHEYLCWRIPYDLTERMLNHFFCVEKRIILGKE